MIGFKSFVDRTVISFEDGITGVVGPNGCGKSNIVDAIRWVMGEMSAKHLRGTEMSDVIFNGSEARPQMGMTGVTLTFDNSDGKAPAEYSSYSEISIGRRLYRSGESEYYINKTACRLKDIVELFLGTGIGTKAYSIVEQEQIGRIVSAKPEEHRILIEEAAGISKFKMRKEAALRKIDATKQNLQRLTDIITELERQKNSLYRQAKKAERYTKFADELRVFELSLSAHKYRTLTDELTTLRNRLNMLSETEASKAATYSDEEISIDTARLELTETEKELNEIQEKAYELQNRLRLTETEIKFKTNQLIERKSRCDEAANEITRLKEKKSNAQKTLTSSNQAKVDADIELAFSQDEVNEAQEKTNEIKRRHDEVNAQVEALRSNIMECVRTSSGSQARLENLEKRDIDLAGLIAKNQTEIDAIDSKISEVEGKSSSTENGLGEMSSIRQELFSALDSAKRENEKLKSELIHNELKFKDANKILSFKQSRYNSLKEIQEGFEGYQEGVRSVLKRRSEAKDTSGVFGTIGEMVETTPQYETAVSAALGEKLQYVVVKSHQESVEAIEYLKTQTTGRSTFIPMELKRSAMESRTVSGEGVVGPMTDYVSFPDQYKTIGQFLFGDVILVQDLKKALNIWKDGDSSKTFVTMDGEVVDPHGVVSGGKSQDISKQFLVQRREIGELKVEINTLSKEVDSFEKTVNSLKNKLQLNEDKENNLKTTLHDHEVECVHKERDVGGLKKELENWKNTRDRLAVDIAAYTEEKHSSETEEKVLVTKIDGITAKQEELEAKLESITGGADEAKGMLTMVLEDLTTKKVDLAAKRERSFSLEKDIVRLTNEFSEIETSIIKEMDDIAEGHQEIATTERELEFAKSSIGKFIADIEETTGKQKALKQRYDERLEAVRRRELGIRELRKAHDETKNELHELQLAETKDSEKLYHLERDIQEKYHVDIATRHEDCQIEVGKDESESDAAERVFTRVQDLRDKLEKMGAVNTDAITEYDDVSQRFEFLSKQYEDLNISLDTLHKTILKINRTSRERFIETFNAVNERFKVLFPKLFRGGKAEIIMTDNENVLESGIDIVVQPPGKKLQHVSLLSGGEKALTAISLIFSIFLIKPSPFCLLDEADAPLDDANIDRFNELVREMSNISQFIVITHNKRTMELADVLYGVIMEEAGVSRVISVKLEAEKEQAA